MSGVTYFSCRMKAEYRGSGINHVTHLHDGPDDDDGFCGSANAKTRLTDPTPLQREPKFLGSKLCGNCKKHSPIQLLDLPQLADSVVVPIKWIQANRVYEDSMVFEKAKQKQESILSKGCPCLIGKRQVSNI